MTPINELILDQMATGEQVYLEKHVIRGLITTYLDGLWGPDKFHLARELLVRMS